MLEVPALAADASRTRAARLAKCSTTRLRGDATGPRVSANPRDEFEEGYFYTAKSANRGVLYASSSPSELMEKYRIS